MITTWEDLINKEMNRQGDSWGALVTSTFKEFELTNEFDCGFGESKGTPFTLWTKTRVYFPVVYDGSEWVASVSRDPDGVATSHVGGK